MLLLLLLASAVAWGGCRVRDPVPVEAPVDDPAPIPLGPSGSHALIFQKVLYRIPNGTVLGEARVGRRVVDEIRWEHRRTQTFEFNVAVTDRMRSLGYDMRDAADVLFDPGARVKVRYELAGVLHAVELDFQHQRDRHTGEAGMGRGRADVRLELQLFDTLLKETVYTRTFSGHGEDVGREPSPITAAVVDAVAKAASDPELVALLSKSASDQADEAGERRLSISECPASRRSPLPEHLDEVLDSVVAIQVGAGWGAGVIVSPEGWVLSAEHVVGDDNEIWVHLRNGIQVPATLVRDDKRLDLALLRLTGRGYPCSRPRLGADEPALGSDVFAVSSLDERSGGRPTISRGVVSGFPSSQGIRLIQTDASVNPGSSGGPLFASDGTVAGIIIRKRQGVGVEGIGLAVPMETVVEGLALDLPSLFELDPRGSLDSRSRSGSFRHIRSGWLRRTPARNGP